MPLSGARADYMSKPFKIDELLVRIRRILEEDRVDLSAEKGDFDCILGSLSNPLRRSIIQTDITEKHHAPHGARTRAEHR